MLSASRRSCTSIIPTDRGLVAVTFSDTNEKVPICHLGEIA